MVIKDKTLNFLHKRKQFDELRQQIAIEIWRWDQKTNRARVQQALDADTSKEGTLTFDKKNSRSLQGMEKQHRRHSRSAMNRKKLETEREKITSWLSKYERDRAYFCCVLRLFSSSEGDRARTTEKGKKGEAPCQLPPIRRIYWKTNFLLFSGKKNQFFFSFCPLSTKFPLIITYTLRSPRSWWWKGKQVFWKTYFLAKLYGDNLCLL